MSMKTWGVVLCVLVGLLWAGAGGCRADGDAALVNMARLSIAKVSASDVNGSRPLDDGFYGVQNMFDDGQNVIGGISYSYWMGTFNASGEWVKVCFEKPVSVSKLVIEFDNSPYPKSDITEHREYALQITTLKGKSRTTDYYDSRSAAGFVSTTTFPKPVKGVSEIKVLLSGFYRPAIQEIRVLGTPPPGVDTTPKTPKVIGQPTLGVRTPAKGIDDIKNPAPAAHPKASSWNDPLPPLVPAGLEADVSEFLGTVAFPDKAEQAARAPKSPPSADTLTRCTEWMHRVMRPEWLPEDLSAHFIPLKAWANGRDALMSRYAVNSHWVQVMYNRSEITVVVARVGDVTTIPAEGRERLMQDTIGRILKVDPPSGFTTTTSASGKVSLGHWSMAFDLQKGPVDPILGISAATDGRFVAIRSTHCYGPTLRPPVIDTPLFDMPDPAKRVTPPPPDPE